jgi:hypothetical protein
MNTTPDPLWRQMLNRSDAALQDPDSATTDDGAIVGAHLLAVADWLRRNFGHLAPVRDGVILALQREARAAKEAR